MECINCAQNLPNNSYAVCEGIYFCLTCFLDQTNNFPTTQTVCETRRTTVLTSFTGTRKDSKEEELDSMTSFSNTQPSKTSNAAEYVATACAKKSNQWKSSSPIVVRSNFSDKQPSRLSIESQRTCQVCCEEQSLEHFPSFYNHHRCQQQRAICNKCVYRHIETSFEKMCTDDVRCPELQCKKKYDYTTIRDILLVNKNKRLFERYEQYLFHHELEQMEEFIWCSNPKCQMGQLNKSGHVNNIVTCVQCHKKTCFIHKTEWHEGLTCDEYDLMIDGNLKKTLKWLNRNTKRCPKCSYQIEKNAGCDHMTCINCQYEFCWACLADYKKIRKRGNNQHYQHCKHYA